MVKNLLSRKGGIDIPIKIRKVQDVGFMICFKVRRHSFFAIMIPFVVFAGVVAEVNIRLNRVVNSIQ
jgi:hypothetical protein